MLILNDNNFTSNIKQNTCLVYFTADWCMPCKKMLPLIQEISKEIKDCNFYIFNVSNE